LPEDATANLTEASRRRPPGPGAPLAIKVGDLRKSFQIPTHKIDSLKERVVHPLRPREYRDLQALNGITFDVRKGEFFGIVGRNGSGKSTLLKLLASIYRADGGRIRMAGRLAPFIELGVGFNLDLTARENVVLNGVMMGLSPAEMRNRLEGVIEFAELQDFVDLKLKNYSSGMLVRLAFSVMMEADADVLLIDEVLAVGDAAFQQKCNDAFVEMKARGKTIVLVTHAMATVESFCDRAMLISNGEIQSLGDPGEVSREYLRLNFEGGSASARTTQGSDDLRLDGAWLEGGDGKETVNVEAGEELCLRTRVEILCETPAIRVGYTLVDENGFGVSQFTTTTEPSETGPLRPGQVVTLEARIENLLTPGRYFFHLGVKREPDSRATVLHVERALDFHVFGLEPDLGAIKLPHTIITAVEGGGDR